MQIPEGENEITVEIGFWNDVPIGRENEGIDFQKKKNWIKIGVLRGKKPKNRLTMINLILLQSVVQS